MKTAKHKVSKKAKATVIKMNGRCTVQLEINEQEYEVLKLSLQHYRNGYSLSTLRAIYRAEA